ncbi:MAG: GDP-L-fucose synthase [Elusimicrobiota bacterium]
MFKTWANKRVIVTGGAGFLGSFLVEKLHERGAKEIFVPRSREHDLTHEANVERLFKDHPTDIVFHLAGVVGGIGANQMNPGAFFYKNMVMGAMLMEYARLNKVSKFVQVGTICAYPKFTPAPFKEDNLWNGYPEETNAPYGLAKKALLVQAQAYRQQYGFNAIYLLPVNLYGPRDNFDLETSHVIPALIRKFMTAKESGAKRVVLWGTGNPTREFLYVKDAAEALALAAEKYNAPEPVNLGSGHEISIRSLAETIGELVGYKGRLQWDESRPDGQPRRLLDTTRATKCFGFTAQTSFGNGIRETIDWYERHAKNL